MRYTKTVTVNTEKELVALHPGQWFKMGIHGYPGQFMGKDKEGKPLVRMGKFSTANAVRNKLLRKLAK